MPSWIRIRIRIRNPACNRDVLHRPLCQDGDKIPECRTFTYIFHLTDGRWPPIKITSYSSFLFIRRAALNWAMWCGAGAASTASTLVAWARRRSRRRPLAAARRRGRRSGGGARTVWPESIPAFSASCRKAKLFLLPLLARYRMGSTIGYNLIGLNRKWKKYSLF